MKHPQSPWWWMPTLYFAEGIPYFIVNNISVTMFTKMGVPNGEMALFTSLLYLPWSARVSMRLAWKSRRPASSV